MISINTSQGVSILAPSRIPYHCCFALVDCLSVYFVVLCRPSSLVVVVVLLVIGHHHVDNFVLGLSFLLGIFEMFLSLGFLHQCVGVRVHVSLTYFCVGSVSPYLTDPCLSYSVVEDPVKSIIGCNVQALLVVNCARSVSFARCLPPQTPISLAFTKVGVASYVFFIAR